MRLLCKIPVFVLAMVFGIAAARAGQIQILDATYGCLCEPPANCSAARSVAASCDGRSSCAVAVGLALCSFDPLPGQGKALQIVYQCSGNPAVRDVRGRDGEAVAVTCQ